VQVQEVVHMSGDRLSPLDASFTIDDGVSHQNIASVSSGQVRRAHA
jgi:hypothetical protein